MNIPNKKQILKDIDDNPGTYHEIKTALRTIGDKWAGLILLCLFDGDTRFKDLEQSLPNINPRTLSKRLKELEAAGLITKQKYNEFPPRTAYRPTQKARDLQNSFHELHKWAHKYYHEC